MGCTAMRPNIWLNIGSCTQAQKAALRGQGKCNSSSNSSR